MDMIGELFQHQAKRLETQLYQQLRDKKQIESIQLQLVTASNQLQRLQLQNTEQQRMLDANEQSIRSMYEHARGMLQERNRVLLLCSQLSKDATLLRATLAEESPEQCRDLSERANSTPIPPQMELPPLAELLPKPSPTDVNANMGNNFQHHHMETALSLLSTVATHKVAASPPEAEKEGGPDGGADSNGSDSGSNDHNGYGHSTGSDAGSHAGSHADSNGGSSSNNSTEGTEGTEGTAVVCRSSGTASATSTSRYKRSDAEKGAEECDSNGSDSGSGNGEGSASSKGTTNVRSSDANSSEGASSLGEGNSSDHSGSPPHEEVANEEQMDSSDVTASIVATDATATIVGLPAKRKR
jgi:hypothetical protein